MKKIIYYSSLLPIFFFHFFGLHSFIPNTYFIYIKPGDQLVNKTSYENTISITYKCSCYARTYNMEFRSDDTSKDFIKDKLTVKYYSMATFAALASKEWEVFKDGHFWHDKIYIIEETAKHKYKYQLVRFYPVEHEE